MTRGHVAGRYWEGYANEASGAGSSASHAAQTNGNEEEVNDDAAVDGSDEMEM